MPRFKLGDIVDASGGELLSGNRSAEVTGVSTDSRTIGKGECFFALRGPNFDGHQFISAALKNGAAATVVEQFSSSVVNEIACIKVPDSLRALQDLARAHRRRCRVSLLAITGSCGKSTTKELVSEVLATRYRVARTQGSYNNHIGVPLGLLTIEERTQIAVTELGANAPGEIAFLSDLAAPTHGVITNVEPSHLEGFGSIEAVARAKGELLDALGEQGVAVLNADNPWTDYFRNRFSGTVLTFGLDSEANVRASHWTLLPPNHTEFQLEGGGQYVIAALGKHNVANALAAIAVGRLFGLSDEDIRDGLARFKPLAMRTKIEVLRGVTVINDAYNANPASMKAALGMLSSLPCKGKRIAALGDMLELGPESAQFHRQLGRWVAQGGIDLLFALGRYSHQVCDAAAEAGMPAGTAKAFENIEALATELERSLQPDDLLLIKGSRLTKMERVMDLLATP